MRGLVDEILCPLQLTQSQEARLAEVNVRSKNKISARFLR